MLLDHNLLLADFCGFGVLGGNATGVLDTISGGGSLDLSILGRRRIGRGGLWGVVHVAPSGPTATLLLEILTDPAPGNVAGRLVAASPVLTQPQLLSGFEFPIEIPAGIKLDRYLTCRFTTVNAFGGPASRWSLGLVPDKGAQTSGV